MSLPSRVLLIDDDEPTLTTTSAQLAPEGFAIELARGGVEALEYLERPPVELVICDVMMPEIDGHAVARAYKAHSEWRYTPLILLTALGTEGAIIAGLEAGADDFVAKPIEGAVLRARARSMLRVGATYRSLRVAGEVSTRDQIIAAARLTERERQVLELILLGRTHDDIATVLGITERTSRYHQQNLLAKLGADSRMDLMRLFL